MTGKLLLDLHEAAEATSIGRSKLYELMAAGTIESVKVGARRLIPADALESFVSRLRAESMREPAPGHHSGAGTGTTSHPIARKGGSRGPS